MALGEALAVNQTLQILRYMYLYERTASFSFCYYSGGSHFCALNSQHSLISLLTLFSRVSFLCCHYSAQSHFHAVIYSAGSYSHALINQQGLIPMLSFSSILFPCYHYSAEAHSYAAIIQQGLIPVIQQYIIVSLSS